MVRLLAIFGYEVMTKKNRKMLIRKRLFHKGYQISYIYFDNFDQENKYELIIEKDTLEEVNIWIQGN